MVAGHTAARTEYFRSGKFVSILGKLGESWRLKRTGQMQGLFEKIKKEVCQRGGGLEFMEHGLLIWERDRVLQT
ncbi:Adenylosuccinate Synthetase Isozyme 2 [Manis pentadactyla]|nr:Adenylosuccinate Synthetase Isozyme 2 [Manis pentadactyla]